jgi:ubiquinone/menaquinone biosynthesis C-methylase UbiE
MEIVQRCLNKLKGFQKITLKSDSQDLEPYWDEKFAADLDVWGTGTVWDEIQYLFVGRTGKVLDIACGTGKTIEILSHYKNIELYGCDISDFLIAKAAARGIGKDHLSVCDATRMNYGDNFFDYSYSIGSLEHFTSDGISRCISESCRVTRGISFHMVPVSRSGNDEGWMKTIQSYHNNSTGWWMGKFRASYVTVMVLDSRWQDRISKGKWFVCMNRPREVEDEIESV